MRKFLQTLNLLIVLLLLTNCQKDNNNTNNAADTDNAIILDQLDGSTIGSNPVGINYISTPHGQGAVFSRANTSKIEYPFSKGLPTEGTIEMRVFVKSGYSYHNYTLTENETSANIFNCGLADVWYKGAILLTVSNSGVITLETALTTTPTYNQLVASTSNFKFNEWHIVSISYGNKGQYIKVDGTLVASNVNFIDPIQACGDWSGNRDVPTVGQLHSVFWQPNQYDSGFEGTVDCFRASATQQDWRLKL